ncbi:acetyl-CoA hydrolase/transferase C-terminal domain-containing protein [Xanthobacter sp. KR7-65]|uniref:acetyl-CoA hydrolase/transferase family protein n=1 Tax=Xanthobacter sp. KR7-65 TaxID=3156612 RepID=UPI0032B346E0
MARIIELEALDFADFVLPGDVVCWGQAAAEPLPLTARLMAQRGHVGGFSAFIGIGLGETPDPAYTDRVGFTSFCGTGTNRKLAAAGALAILPVHYSDLPGLLSGRVDVLLLQVAEHPDGGRFSLSCACDYVETLVRSARVVIAEVNRRAPFTSAEIGAADINALILTDRPLPELARSVPTSVEGAIAEHVASLVPDGATLQFGLGAVPDCVADLLSDRRNLGLHTGVLSDGPMGLIRAGAVTNVMKPHHRGVTVAGTLLGSHELLEFAHLNPAIAMRPISVTHSLAMLAQLPAFTAINSALEVDLTGQANTEMVGGRYVGTIGGALDFLRGARASAGGLPIIALPSTAEVKGQHRSRIVARLSGPATIGRADAAIIVTEHGIADLRSLTLAQRAEALIAIADPTLRDDLHEGWRSNA